MALTLMPDGKTFKKLNAAQEKALKGYYNRLHDKPLTETLGLPIGLAVLGGIGAIAYVFKDELQQYLKDKEEDVVDWIKGLPAAGGGVVADAIINLGDAIFPANPVNPEYIHFPPYSETHPDYGKFRPPAGPYSRCERWGLDSDDWLAKVQTGNYSTVEAALAAKRIITNMKKEGCSRPSAFTVAQWED